MVLLREGIGPAVYVYALGTRGFDQLERPFSELNFKEPIPIPTPPVIPPQVRDDWSFLPVPPSQVRLEA